jgi:hypothetical protein
MRLPFFKSVFKSFLLRIIPRKLVFLYHVIRDNRFKEYITGIRQYRKDGNLAPSAFPQYLSVVAIVKNETPYIIEWIEYHLLVGIQKFFIYDNESTDNLWEILQAYIKEDIVEYTFFPGKRQQMSVYNDAIQRFRYKSFWIAFIDIDEFIVSVTPPPPLAAGTITQFLRDFEDAPGIEINQVVYGSSGHRKKKEGLVIERFKDHAEYEFYDNRAVKSIVNPRRVCYMASAHVAEYFNGECSVDSDKNKTAIPPLNRTPLHHKIRINHYATKSFEEFVSRIELGRASSPGKMRPQDFSDRDHNEIKSDAIMDKYIPIIKNRLKH